MAMSDFDAIVVGAGVVGIAVARSIALSGRTVLLLDGERHFGSWTSSRNSEVIHAGIYYAVGSLKSRLCVSGKEKLYSYCSAHGIPHRQVGKLIFASGPSQHEALEKIAGLASAQGVDLQWLGADEARRFEPELDCSAALWSPTTGIVDVHAFMLAMLGEAEAHDAMFVPNSRVERVSRADGLWYVHLPGEAEAIAGAPILVNSAGLEAQRLASATEGLDPVHVPQLHLARGIYFGYGGTVPFTHLIYPVPEPGGLGLHLTLDLAGRARFGPDVEWIDAVDYSINESRKPAFVAGARRIWSGIDPDKLYADYAGVRPKLSGAGMPAGDFAISGPETHGCPGLVNLFGIESPGLTSSLAIGELVMEMLNS